MRVFYRALFKALCVLGTPVGGIRPRRIYHWLAERGYQQRPSDQEFSWRGDRWGTQFLVHPYFHIDRSIIAFGCYECHLLKFLESQVRSGMVCVDVGANSGQIAMHLGQCVGPTGRVYAFEPLGSQAARLRQHIRRNGLEQVVAVHQVALSRSTGPAAFFEVDPSSPNQGRSSLATGAESTSAVDAMSLDDFVAEHGLKRLDWIKIDIQGAEPWLLEGATETLRRFSPSIVMEISSEDLRAIGWTSADLVGLMERLSYRVFELKGSRVGKQIGAASLPRDYNASSVYCQPIASHGESER